jgi:hypothetical protein
MHLPRLLPWAVRASWATLPFTVGAALAGALDERSMALRSTASAGLWAAWAVVLVATLVPHPAGLTALRASAPAVLAATVLAAVDGEAGVVSFGVAVVLVGLCFLPETAMHFVNGPAYPNERRFPLRAPGPVLVAGLLPAWAAVVGPVPAGVLLWAAGRVVPGVAVVLVGLPVAVVLLRALHGLSRRWVVFVPAGLVLHDPLALSDPVLFPKKVVEELRLAPAGTDSLDLTQGAFGLALELLLREKVPMVLTVPGSRSGEPGASARLLFSPTRPGAVLREAATRGLPVSSPVLGG